MKNLFLKLAVCVAISLAAVSCRQHYHIGWSDFQSEEFLSLSPYEVGDTLKFVSSDLDSLTEMYFVVESNEYIYDREDVAGWHCTCIPTENAKLNLVLVNDAGGEISCYIYLSERQSLYCQVIGKSASGYQEFYVSEYFDIEILNDNYDFTLDDSYIINKRYINPTSYQFIEFEIEKGIGISRMTFDDITYNLVQ